MTSTPPPFSAMAMSTFFSSPVLTIVLTNPPNVEPIQQDLDPANPNKRKRSVSLGSDELSQEKRLQQVTNSSTNGDGAEFGRDGTMMESVDDAVPLSEVLVLTGSGDGLDSTTEGLGLMSTTLQTAELESIPAIEEASPLDTNGTASQSLEPESQLQPEQPAPTVFTVELEATTSTQTDPLPSQTTESETGPVTPENLSPTTPDEALSPTPPHETINESLQPESNQDETAERAMEEAMDEVVDSNVQQTVEVVVPEAPEAMVEDVVQQVVQEAAEAMVEDVVEEDAEITTEGVVEAVVQGSVEAIAANPVEQVLEEATESMVEDIVEDSVQEVLVTSDGQSTAAEVEMGPETVIPEPATSETTETAAPAVQRPREEPVFQVHISVLIAQSDYFKSLVSFNGLEVSRGHVNFESPAAYSFSEDITNVAFRCFIDYIYTGNYNLAAYQVGEDKHKIMFMPEQMTYHSAIYVLAERLLSDGLKKLAIKKLYALIYGFHFKKYNKPTPLPAPTPEDVLIYSHNNSTGIKEPWWPHFDLAVRIAFTGTLPKNGIPPAPPTPLPAPTPINTNAISLLVTLPTRYPDSPIQPSESHTRATWLSGEPLRNLLAAFFASIWPSSFDKKGSISEAGMAGRKRLAENSELMQLVVVYLANPRTTFMFSAYPLRDFGITEEDRVALGCLRPAYKVEKCPGVH